MSEFCDVNMSIVDNVWIKQMHFQKKGWIAQTHAHTHDHQTLLAKGSLRVTVNGQWKMYRAPTIVLIEKGALHSLEALEDDTVAYCVHALRDGEDLVENIPNEALQHLA